MIQTIIIDDESSARIVLRKKLEENFGSEITVVAEAEDVDSGIKAVRAHKPDLIFLDIKMRKGTGFDLLKQLGEVDFEVVFITAYDNFAIQAFEFSAFGYLLKPVKTADLRKMLDRLNRERKKNRNSFDQRAKILIENYGNESGKVKRIVINNVEGFTVLDLEKIIRLKAESNYTHFILEGGKKVTVSRTLGEYEELLTAHGFFRIHQSHIVNLKHITGYLKTARGQVKTSDGELLQISRNRKEAFFARFV